MLAMATDLAVKCATLNPHLRSEAAAQTPGVVLIDEIDLHLHPKWQRRVVDDLMRAFEQIQFVATTHSPFVIQSLPTSEGVQLINLDDQSKEDFSDKSVEDIVEFVQGVELPQRSQRHVDMMRQATKYYQLIADDSATSTEEKQAARRELEQQLAPYSDSPAYHAFIKMQQLAAEKNDGGRGEDAAQGAGSP